MSSRPTSVQPNTETARVARWLESAEVQPKITKLVQAWEATELPLEVLATRLQDLVSTKVQASGIKINLAKVDWLFLARRLNGLLMSKPYC